GGGGACATCWADAAFVGLADSHRVQLRGSPGGDHILRPLPRTHSVLGLRIMPSIKLDAVSVAFPIYSSGSRSLKNAVISATTGGRIANQQRHVVIQALDNVSLEIGHGDRVGLIGHNGAGKTTLLRVMAGIYEPLQGEVTVEGVVTPMFDTCLGIDVDSTGYENITLCGLYMGLS